MLRARQFKGALAGTASLLLMAGAAAPAMAADEFGVKAFDGTLVSAGHTGDPELETKPHTEPVPQHSSEDSQ